MKLDLHEIIEIPDSSLPFDCELPADALLFPHIREYLEPPAARGEVKNSAGALSLRGEIRTRMRQVCDRCLMEFEAEKTIPLDVPLTDSPIDPDGSELFPIVGDELDLSALLESVFVLEMDAKSLCGEDCRGLCPGCGANLNEEACRCGAKTDPRLAVLGQLLDIENE